MRLALPEFGSQKELINYLVSNKKELIDIGKSETKKFVDSPSIIIPKKDIIVKSEQQALQDTEDVIYRTIVGNTYNWMDSHDDVHVNNVFAQSIKDRSGRIWHRHDHVNQLVAKVGKFSNVYEQVLNWTDLGVNKMGQTMSLLADSQIKRSYNSLIFDSYKDGEIDQHSVGMQYVKILLAVNDPDNKEEFETWNKYIGTLGNPEKALKRGFFWVILEAKLIEISCVTDGSNELTGVYNPPIGSIKNDPPKEQSEGVWDYYIIN